MHDNHDSLYLAEQGYKQKKTSQGKFLWECGIWLQTQKTFIKQKWMSRQVLRSDILKTLWCFLPSGPCPSLAVITQLGCTVATWRKTKFSLQEQGRKHCQWILFPVPSPRIRLPTFPYPARYSCTREKESHNYSECARILHIISLNESKWSSRVWISI